MARSAKHPCRQSGCSVLLDKSGYCADHQRQVHRQQKILASLDQIERNRFYQRAVWKKLRDHILQHEPLCRSCRKNNVLVAAHHVDHIVPFVTSDDPMAVEYTNLQPLCKSCHSAKTLAETMGRGV